jgi:hypothetical protein
VLIYRLAFLGVLWLELLLSRSLFLLSECFLWLFDAFFEDVFAGGLCRIAAK